MTLLYNVSFHSVKKWKPTNQKRTLTKWILFSDDAVCLNIYVNLWSYQWNTWPVSDDYNTRNKVTLCEKGIFRATNLFARNQTIIPYIQQTMHTWILTDKKEREKKVKDKGINKFPLFACRPRRLTHWPRQQQRYHGIWSHFLSSKFQNETK